MEIVVGLPRDPRGKLLAGAEAAQRVREWHRVGRRTVFSNGCFDLLHLGHARYLAAARALGDALIVGVNADESVRRIKGERRPLVPERERAELVAALECVDLVCLFPEDDPGRLIAELQPRILVKGADWAPEAIVGKEVVEAYGGEVKTVPLVAGKSTTRLIETILERYR